MPAKCEYCGSKDVTLVDSHKSYSDMVNYTTVKYYDCNLCDRRFSVELEI